MDINLIQKNCPSTSMVRRLNTIWNQCARFLVCMNTLLNNTVVKIEFVSTNSIMSLVVIIKMMYALNLDTANDITTQQTFLLVDFLRFGDS